MLHSNRSLFSPDTTRPDCLVEAGVNTNILCVHLLLGKLADNLDGSRRALLESNGVESLVQMNCALASDNFIDS